MNRMQLKASPPNSGLFGVFFRGMLSILSLAVLVILVPKFGLAEDDEPASDDRFARAVLAYMPSELPQREVEEGWISLFDGETLFGWRNVGDANFKAANGLIQVSKGTSPCLLRTSMQFDHYILKMRFLTDKGTNSGLFLRTSPKPTNPSIDCYELNLADKGTSPFPTGALVGRLGRSEDVVDDVRWQSLEVSVIEDLVRVTIDGIEVCEYIDPKPLGRGYIGLQFNSGRVAFGDIRLKPLQLEEKFNGTDLKQWRTHPDLDGEFKITDAGELQVLGGRGQLETRDSYGDFVLQLKCKTQAPDLNSGVFFRCIPEEIMNGYESQIHNGILGNDPTAPEDFGTGGIFRRQPARRVVSIDQKWFRKTIIAVGPNVSVWVDGFQVVDWRDSRAADLNPRRGRRLEAGTIMLQAHDETTNVLFKDISVRELSKRNR